MPDITLTSIELETAIDALLDRKEQTFDFVNTVPMPDETRQELVEAAVEYGDLAEKLGGYRA